MKTCFVVLFLNFAHLVFSHSILIRGMSHSFLGHNDMCFQGQQLIFVSMLRPRHQAEVNDLLMFVCTITEETLLIGDTFWYELDSDYIFAFLNFQRTFQKNGHPKWNTSVPTSPSSLWATRRTSGMMNTHAGSWPRWNKCVSASSIIIFLAFITFTAYCLHETLNPFCISQEPVKSEEGRDMANRISAFGYLECSAKTKDGVRDVFEMATRAALQVRKRKKRGGCQLLWRGPVSVGSSAPMGGPSPTHRANLEKNLNQWLP